MHAENCTRPSTKPKDDPRDMTPTDRRQRSYEPRQRLVENPQGNPQGRAHSRPTSSEAPRQRSYSSFPKQLHQQRSCHPSEAGAGLPFKILTAVLKFLEAPLHHSLWWLAVVAAWMGFSGFVFLVATAGMMLHIGDRLIADGFIIALGASGWWMVCQWLPRKTR